MDIPVKIGEQLNNNMVRTVKENEQESIPRFGPWMFVMVSIDILKG